MTDFFSSHGIDRSQLPHAQKVPQLRVHHGREFVDNYEWMRQKDSAEVQEYVAAQNAISDAVAAGLAPLKQTLFDELKSRVQETDMSVPTRVGDYWYFSRTEEGKQYGRQCRVPVRGADDWTAPEISVDELLEGEEVVFDADLESQGHDFFRSGGLDLDKAGRLLVYSLDTEGDERYDVHLRDLTTGEDLPDVIHRVSSGAFCTPDGQWIFYVRTDDAWRPCELWLHRVGDASGADDRCVFTEPDERFWMGAGLSFDESMIIIESSSKTTSEVLHLPVADIPGLLVEDADSADARRFTPFIARKEGVEYDVTFARFEGCGEGGADVPVAVVVHNVRHPNFEIDIIDMSGHEPGRQYELGEGTCVAVGSDYGCEQASDEDRTRAVSEPFFSEVNPQILQGTAGLQVGGLGIYKNFVTLSYRADGLGHCAVMSKHQAFEDWKAGRPLSFTKLGESDPDVLPSVGFGANPSYESPVLRYGFGSYTQPSQLRELNPLTGEDRLLRKAHVQNYDASLYAERRLWVVARDGVRVPVSLVWRRGMVPALDSRPISASELTAPALEDMYGAQEKESTGAPMYIYGYGSYEASMSPSFSVARPSIMDRGVVFCVAHVRGGGEMGRAWYEQGRRLKKTTTFNDFVDVTAALEHAGIADPRRTVANGGSAGGLLMGAIANAAPFLYAGIEADVPFVDALTSILDESLPLTVTEWDEWGDPLHNAQVYDYMKAYTPYENVMTSQQREETFGTDYFPVIFITTSMNDTRVLYVEPLKWIARLTEPEVGVEAFAKIEVEAGHGGVSGRYKQWDEVSLENAWTLDLMGIHE
ncbi:S9 family peptidase [Alloscardovia macacae]|uniref:S9 family peptidase n=1 Tax=Alloscardovia macacae TaxID=1160091 RepID=A0A1Y2T180_9BIFI|nr:prolyl oligopeptidase family serine peptidase [Alloscardovia macacae]OTA26258.1 S9 family peptidase [Alloscardovia macacae]OTA28919.1 S9 family peptidase [Alloscardovia macacae]